jgi:carboxypeptidase Taq
MSAYSELMAFQRQTEALGAIAGRLGWDQETMMPRGSAGQRSEEMAAIEGVLHARRTDPKVGEWLEASVPDSDVARANLRLIKRQYDRTMKVPARLASEIASVTSRAQGIWAQARATEDVPAFLPILTEVIALRREEAAALAEGGSLYDALLADYEPGTSSAEIAALFDRMRPRLVALRDRIFGAAHQPSKLNGTFADDQQAEIATKLALAFGYDLNTGRIDRAVHPFSSGSGQDVRITTRVSETDPFNCFYSTIHEVGHAAYEQGIAPEHLLTPLGRGVSMGVHESQSRIYENQLGRGQAFTGWLYKQMTAAFGDLGLPDGDAFYGAVNRCSPSYIRTEADEVQYNLHVMLRFDLERAIISGDLKPADLEGAWNERFAADFGIAVDKPSNGVLQDVHWSVGLFGYFPTYSLGNVYAGCLFETLKSAVPDWEQGLGQGDASAATGWLRENVQQFGGLYEPVEVIERASGTAPSEEPLLSYLEGKFGAIYRL